MSIHIYIKDTQCSSRQDVRNAVDDNIRSSSNRQDMQNAVVDKIRKMQWSTRYISKMHSSTIYATAVIDKIRNSVVDKIRKM